MPGTITAQLVVSLLRFWFSLWNQVALFLKVWRTPTCSHFFVMHFFTFSHLVYFHSSQPLCKIPYFTFTFTFGFDTIQEQKESPKVLTSCHVHKRKRSL